MGLLDIIKNKANQAGAAISNVASSTGQALESAYTTTANAVGGAVDSGIKTAGAVIDSGTQLAQDIGSSVKTEIDNWNTAAGQAGSDLYDKVQQRSSGDDNILDHVANVVGAYADQNKATNTAIGSAIGNTLDVADEVPRFAGSVLRTGEQINDRRKSDMNPHEGAMDEIFNTLGAFGSLYQDEKAKYDEQVRSDPSSRNRILDAAGSLANAPIMIGNGMVTASDTSKTATERIKGVTDIGLGVVSTMPAAALWSGAYETLAPSGAKKAVGDAVGVMSKDITDFGVNTLGMDPRNAKAATEIIRNVFGIAAGIAGPKIGQGVTSGTAKVLGTGALSKAVSGGAGMTANMFTQAAPDLIPLAWNYIKNYQENPNFDGKTAMSQMVYQAATMLPFSRLKGLRGGNDMNTPKYTSDQEVRAQMYRDGRNSLRNLETDTTLTPDQKSHIVRTASSTEQFSRPTTPDVPVNDKPSFTPNEEIRAQMYRDGRNSLQNLESDPSLTADQKSHIVRTVGGVDQHPSISTSKPFTKTKPTPEQVAEANRILSMKQSGADVAIETSSILTKDQEKIILSEAENVKPKEPVQDTPPADVPKTPDTPVDNPPIATKLDNILSSFNMGSDVFVSRSKNVMNKWAGTIAGYTEKGLSNIAGRTINLRNIAQTARNSMPIFANAMLESVGYDKRSNAFPREIKINPEDVIGGRTPNEGMEITSFDQVRDAIQNPVPNAIKNFIGAKAVKDLENTARAEYLYQIHQANPQKLTQLFSPEEIKMMQDKIAMRDAISVEGSQFLVNKGLLSEYQLKEGYTRYVLNDKARQDIIGNPIEVEINGKKYLFKDIDDLQTSANLRRSEGLADIADNMESVGNSLLKEKAVGIDTKRVHSPTVQMLSYSMEVGKMLQGKAVLDNFRAFNTKDAKGLPTENSRFISELFPDYGPSEKLNSIVGISMRSNSTLGKGMEFMAKMTRTASTAILFGRVATMIQPVFSTVPKGVLVMTANKLGVNPKAIFSMDPRASEIMESNGFLPEFQAFDTSPTGAIEKGAHAVAAEFSGRSIELASKKMAALSQMKSALNDAGVKTSGDALDIATKWEEWARNPENRESYLVAQDKIQENLDWMGSSTIFNKSMHDVVRKTNFQALTGYVNGQVNKFMTDVGRVVGGIETGDGQRKEAAMRLAGSFGIWAGNVALAMSYLSNENPEADDETILDLSMQWANRNVGNGVQQLYDISSNFLNSPISVVTTITKDGIIAASKTLTGEDDAKVYWDKFFNKAIDTIGATNSFEALTGGSLKQAVADKLGTANMSKMTDAGNARYVQDEGLGAMLFNMKPQQFMQNFLFEKITEAQVDQEFQNPIMKEAAFFAKDWFNNVKKPLENITTFFEGDGIKYERVQAIHDLYRKMKPEDTLSSFMGKIGITDPTLVQAIMADIQQLSKTALGSSGKDMSGNIAAATITQTDGTQFFTNEEFGKYMTEMEEKNPYVYNQILSGLTNISEHNTKDPLKVDQYGMDTIKALISKSTPKDDAVIAAISSKNPNTTALSNAVIKAYGDMAGRDASLEETKNGLTFINEIMRLSQQGGPWTTGLQKSMALASFSTLPGIIDKMKQYGQEGMDALLKTTPFLTKAITEGLRYRGWQQDTNQSSLGIDGNQTLAPVVPTAPTMGVVGASSTGGSLTKAAKLSIAKAGASGANKDVQKDRKVLTLSDIIKNKQEQVLPTKRK